MRKIDTNDMLLQVTTKITAFIILLFPFTYFLRDITTLAGGSLAA